MSGPNKKEFPIKIDRKAVRDIDKMPSVYQDRRLCDFIDQGGSPTEIAVVATLIALISYLEERRVTPDFELVLND